MKNGDTIMGNYPWLYCPRYSNMASWEICELNEGSNLQGGALQLQVGL